MKHNHDIERDLNETIKLITVEKSLKHNILCAGSLIGSIGELKVKLIEQRIALFGGHFIRRFKKSQLLGLLTKPKVIDFGLTVYL